MAQQQQQQFAKVYEDGWDDSLDGQEETGELDGAAAATPATVAPKSVAPIVQCAAAPAPALPISPPPAPLPTPAPMAVAAPTPQPPAAAAAQAQKLAPWPARDRAGLYPALFSRSALFQVGRGKRAEGGAGPAPTPKSVACQGEHELTATGPRLSMRDKAVWEFALDRARAAGQIGVEFELSARACALALGATKDRSSETLRRVRESLKRLAATTLAYELSTGEKGSCKLLGTSRRDGKACVVALDPDLGGLLEADFLFATDSRRRVGLPSDLAKWLHDFHSTHEQFDGAFSLQTLRGLCGFEAQEGHFPSQLEAALQAVKQAAPGLLADFQLAKPTAKADSWKASVTRGEEVVNFEMPEREWRKRGRRPNL
jgi:hypothetical protein